MADNLKIVLGTKQEWEAGILPPQVDSITSPGFVQMYRPSLSFTRSSVAYLPNGTQIASGLARYWYGRYTNLLTPNQSDVETDSSGWNFGGGGTYWNRATDKAWQGSASIKFSSATGVTVTSSMSPLISVIPGKTYIFSAYGFIPSNKAGSTYIDWIEWIAQTGGTLMLDGGGGGYDNWNGLPKDSWQRRWVKFTPAQSWIELRIVCDGDSTGDAWFDGFQLEEAIAGQTTPTDWRLGSSGKAIMIEEGTTNLLTANQSDIETDTTGFTPVNSTLASVTTPVSHGSGALSVTSSGTNSDCFVSVGGDIGAVQLGMQAGSTYTFSAYIQVPAATGLSPDQAVRGLRIVAFTRVGTAGYVETAGSMATATDKYQRISVTFSVPTGATEAFVRLYNGFLVAGKVVYFDALQLERNTSATSWMLGGTSRDIETLVIPGINWANVSFTVEAWVNISADKGTGDHGILTSNEVGTFYKSLHLVIRDGKPYLGFYGDDLASPTVVTDGNWHFVAFGYDSLTKRQVIWVDGQPPISHTVASQYLGKISDTFIGGGTSPSLDGYMANLRISTVLRTDAEIAAAYNATAPLTADSNTLALFSFDNSLTSSYPASATIITKAIDLGVIHATPLDLTAVATTPTGTSVKLSRYRTSKDGINWNEWSEINE